MVSLSDSKLEIIESEQNRGEYTQIPSLPRSGGRERATHANMDAQMGKSRAVNPVICMYTGISGLQV